MDSFISYCCPTKVLFTEDSVNQIGAVLKENGYSRVYFVYGSHSLKASGNYEKIVASLNRYGISFREKGGIRANPEISFVREILPEVRAYKPDAVLAVGGGSVLDTAKNLCCAYYYSGDSLDFNKKKAIPTKALPLVTIITVAAAGSEMSDSCVMSDYASGFKSGYNSIFNRPAVSLEDPTLTLNVPLFQTCCGLVDILSHSFERYFSPSKEYESCDYLALGVMKNIVDITPVLLKNPHDLDARRSMMHASTLSHNGITSFGKKMRFICHGVEHQLSGKHPEIAHGLGLRFLLAEFLKINKDLLNEKIVRFGKEVFELKNPDADEAIRCFSAYLDSLPLPHAMEEIGIPEEEKNSYLSQLKVSD